MLIDKWLALVSGDERSENPPSHLTSHLGCWGCAHPVQTFALHEICSSPVSVVSESECAVAGDYEGQGGSFYRGQMPHELAGISYCGSVPSTFFLANPCCNPLVHDTTLLLLLSCKYYHIYSASAFSLQACCQPRLYLMTSPCCQYAATYCMQLTNRFVLHSLAMSCRVWHSFMLAVTSSGLKAWIETLTTQVRASNALPRTVSSFLLPCLRL